jgi:hypothetical protein
MDAACQIRNASSDTAVHRDLIALVARRKNIDDTYNSSDRPLDRNDISERCVTLFVRIEGTEDFLFGLHRIATGPLKQRRISWGQEPAV